MPNSDDVTGWYHLLRAGDSLAAQQLWDCFFARLVGLAHRKLRASNRRVADEEDVALSAFHSFCRGVLEGGFPDIRDRDELWRLLVVITARKAGQQLRYERRDKRGRGKVRGESALGPIGEDSSHGEIPSAQPRPEFSVIVAEELAHLLERLGDESLRRLALLKLEGYENREIADRLGCGLRTVERRLRGIRAIWSEELPK